MNAQPLTMEYIYDAPVSRVWQALTDNDQMKQWYFNIADFKPEVDFEFRFEGGDEHKTYLHLCRITEVIPQEKLSYTWHYDGLPGQSEVSFELFPQGSGTRLRLTHTGLETFKSDDDPNFATSSFQAGWTHILGKSLKEFVDPPIQ